MLKVRLVNNTPPSEWERKPEPNAAEADSLRQMDLAIKALEERWIQPEVPLIRGREYRWLDSPDLRYRYIGTIEGGLIMRLMLSTDPTRPGYQKEMAGALAKYVRSTQEDDAQPRHQVLRAGDYKYNTATKALEEIKTSGARRMFVFKTEDDQFLITAGSRGLTPT